MRNMSRRSLVAGRMTLGFLVLVSLAAVSSAAGEHGTAEQSAGGEVGQAKSVGGQTKSIPPAPGLEDAYKLEAQGRLEEALATLPEDKVEGDAKKHRDVLLKILVSMWAADAYASLGRPERARETFEEERPKGTELDPIRDAPLFVVLASLRDHYDLAAAGPAAELATAKLAKAKALRRAGNYAQAATVYREVAMANATASATSAPLPEGLVQQALVGAIESDRDDTSSKNLLTQQGAIAQVWGAFLEVVSALTTALRYIFFFAVALGLFMMLVQFPDWRRARPEVVLDLKDLVSPAGGQAGSQPAGGPDRALTHDFLLAVQSLARDSDGLGEVILSRDTDSQAFADLRVIDNDLIKEFEQAITGSDPVKLGPVSFTPRELFELLRRAFERPPVLTLTGSLSRSPSDGAAGVSDGRVSLYVVGLIRGRGSLKGPSPFPNVSNWPPSPRRWDAAHSGPYARERVVREVAASFVFHTIKTNVTLDWPSFRDYHEAMYLNRLEDPVAPPPPADSPNPAGTAPKPAHERMIQAAALLQSSVRHDPTNWLAAFFFGDVLRRLGRNAAAARVFHGLGGRISLARALPEHACGHTDEPLSRLRAFLERPDSSDFEAVVAYNEAVSLSKTNDRVKNLSAIDMLGRLVKTSQESDSFAPTLEAVLGLSRDTRPVPAALSLDIPAVWPTGGSRLAMFGLSALASALVVEFEALRYGQAAARKAGTKADEGHKEPESGDRHQKRRNTAFAAIVAIDRELDTYENNPLTDRATFNIARGLARSALGRAYYIAGRYELAYEALTDATELLPDFAEAYINLASVCLVDRGGKPGWVLEAQEHLQTALTLNPSNSKANYLMGKLCVRLGLDRLAEAETYFLRAGRDVWADLEVARLYADLLEPPDLKKALWRLQSSLSLFPTADYRPIAFLDYVIRLTPSDLDDDRFKRSLCATLQKIRPDKLDTKFLRARARTLLAQAIQSLGCPARPAREGAGESEPSRTEHGEALRIPTTPKATQAKTDGPTDASVTPPHESASEESGSHVEAQ
jgi:tetratricopeptide (TPR) repeat protein